MPVALINRERNRKATLLSADAVLRLNNELGLHPNLTGFRVLLDQHALAVVQGVGYPNPNRSHFKSMDIWHLADNSSRPNSCGWIGRYCDSAFKGQPDPKRVIAVGSDRAPLAIQGKEHSGISLQRPETYRYFGDRGNRRLAAAYRTLNRISAVEDSRNPSLQFVAKTAIDANATSEEIAKLASQRTSSVSYPATRLGESLRTVAALLGGGLSTRVYYVFQGGFDTHAGQKARHDRLMTELSQAVAAFHKELSAQGNAERVLTLVFSEFGRRVRENGSQGTDHGTAAPMFLVGPGVKPGLHGQHPSLAPGDLDHGDLKHAIDFRSVYATVLEKWLDTPSEPILGKQFPLVSCLA